MRRLLRPALRECVHIRTEADVLDVAPRHRERELGVVVPAAGDDRLPNLGRVARYHHVERRRVRQHEPHHVVHSEYRAAEARDDAVAIRGELGVICGGVPRRGRPVDGNRDEHRQAHAVELDQISSLAGGGEEFGLSAWRDLTAEGGGGAKAAGALSPVVPRECRRATMVSPDTTACFVASTRSCTLRWTSMARALSMPGMLRVPSS